MKMGHRRSYKRDNRQIKDSSREVTWVVEWAAACLEECHLEWTHKWCSKCRITRKCNSSCSRWLVVEEAGCQAWAALTTWADKVLQHLNTAKYFKSTVSFTSRRSSRTTLEWSSTSGHQHAHRACDSSQPSSRQHEETQTRMLCSVQYKLTKIVK